MKKILIIEDDKFLAKTYKRAFDPQEFEVQVLYDGENALQHIKDFKPNALILDIIVPIKDGFEILKEMKDDVETKDIPVIIASNLGQEEDYAKGLKMGAKAFITKSETSLTGVVDVVKKNLN